MMAVPRKVGETSVTLRLMSFLEPKHIIGPVFWIALTYVAMTYGSRLLKKEEGLQKQSVSSSSIGSVLGDQGQSRQRDSDEGASSSDDNSAPHDKSPLTPTTIGQRVKQIIEDMTAQMIAKSGSEVTEKKEKIAETVCQELIAELEKQCTEK